jgi:hypothetical protein
MAKTMTRDQGEIVLVLDEAEICVLWTSLKATIATKKWDLNDEADWAELVFSKNLLNSLECYLDDLPVSI